MQGRYKTILVVVIVVLTVGITAGIIWQSAKKDSEPEYVFTYAENQSEGYPTSQGAYYFADLVYERTDGRIKILVYTGAELGREAEVIEQLRYGGVDFARVSLSQLAEVDERLNVLQMPYLYNDSEHMWRVLDGEIGETFLQQISDYDLVGLSWYDAGSRNFYNSVKPIRKAGDMEGMVIRVQQSELMEDIVNCLGATALPLSYEEVYSALELGTIDGAENNWPSYEDTSHYLVAGYFTEDEHTRVPEMQLCSANTWKQLSVADRQIIMDCARESALYERDLWADRVEESKQKAIAAGVTVSYISESEKAVFRSLMAPVYEKYCSEYMDLIERIIAEGEK